MSNKIAIMSQFTNGKTYVFNAPTGNYEPNKCIVYSYFSEVTTPTQYKVNLKFNIQNSTFKLFTNNYSYRNGYVLCENANAYISNSSQIKTEYFYNINGNYTFYNIYETSLGMSEMEPLVYGYGGSGSDDFAKLTSQGSKKWYNPGGAPTTSTIYYKEVDLVDDGDSQLSSFNINNVNISTAQTSLDLTFCVDALRPTNEYDDYTTTELYDNNLNSISPFDLRITINNIQTSPTVTCETGIFDCTASSTSRTSGGIKYFDVTLNVTDWGVLYI